MKVLLPSRTHAGATMLTQLSKLVTVFTELSAGVRTKVEQNSPSLKSTDCTAVVNEAPREVSV